MSKQIVLMDKSRVERSLKRMAIELWEKLEQNDELILIGLNERGYATASLLKKFVEEITEVDNIQLVKHDIKNLTHNDPLPECTEKFVVIVDDVIFSGKTMFDALKAIISTGEPKKVEVLTLLDRGHRKYPIQSNITGMSVPTKFGEHIEVMLSEDQPEQVILFKNN